MAKKKSSKNKVIIPDILDDEQGSKSTAPSSNLPILGDSLSMYLAQISKYDLLSKEEEKKLALKYYEEGDSKAAERLVTANLRFVVSVASEYAKFGARMIDLIQEGNIGLMHAVKEFNPYKGVRLITYAVWWIRGYIREYLLKQYSMVKLSTSSEQKKLFYQLQKEQKRLDALGEELDIEKFSEDLGVSTEKVEDMQARLLQRDLSLDQPIDGESGTMLIDMQSQDMPEALDEQLANLQEIEILKEKLDEISENLNEKEKYILVHRLLGDPPQTLQAIGDHFGISRERSRQIEANVLKKIREKLQAD